MHGMDNFKISKYLYNNTVFSTRFIRASNCAQYTDMTILFALPQVCKHFHAS